MTASATERGRLPASAVVDVVLAGALAAVVGAGFRDLFAPVDLILPVGVASVGAAAVSVWARAWPRFFLPFVHLAGMAACLFVGLKFPAPIPAARGLVEGWAGLLSTTLPASPDPRQLVVAPAIVYVVAAIGSELAMRTRSRFLILAPALGGHLIARVLAGSAAAAAPLTAAALAGLGSAVVFVRTATVRAYEDESPADDSPPDPGATNDPPPAMGWRRWASIPILVAATAVAALIAPTLPWATVREPFDPRSLRTIQPETSRTINPLARISALLSTGDAPLFTMQAKALGSTKAIVISPKLVVLSDYGSGQWTMGTGDSAASFRSSGIVLPSPDGPLAGGPDTLVRQTIRFLGADRDGVVLSYAEPFIPVAGEPRRIEGVAALFDTGSGVLLRPADVELTEVTLISAVPVPDERVWPGARASTAASFDRYRLLPADLPSSFAATGAEAMVGSENAADFARASALQQYFKTQFSANSDAPVGGSGVAQLDDVLIDHIGASSEQFAAAFAVVARTLGFASRVAVGFRDVPATGEEVAIRGRDIAAWPELAFDGLGWIPFDPTPVDAALPPDRQISLSAQAPSRLADKVAASEITTPAVPGATSDAARAAAAVQAPASSWPARVLLAGGAVLALCGAALGAIPLVKRRRRRLRRSGPFDAQVLGAWHELVGILRERGLPLATAMTGTEVVRASIDLVGDDAAGEVQNIAGPPGMNVGRFRDLGGVGVRGAVRGRWVRE